MRAPVQLPLDFGWDAALDHDEFLTAACNQEAAAWLTNWPDWLARTIVLYGPAGCGKTHLLSIWKRRADALLLTPEDLPALDPPAAITTSRAVAIDDVDRAFSGSGPGALLHLYNLVHEAKGWLLMTGRSPPSAWHITSPDLASRLRAALAVPIGEPDETLLAALLVKQFADRQLSVTPEVIRFLSTRIERSFAAVRTVVADLDRASMSRKQVIGRKLAASVLATGDAGEEP